MSETIKDQAVEAVAFVAGEAVGEGRKEIRLVPWGIVESKSGTFVVDEEAASAIVERFKCHGAALPIDWEHATMRAKYKAPDGRAPAAGWIEDIVVREGQGIFGSVAWTAEGRKAIQSGSYRYLSPVLLIEKDTRRAVEISSAALTNKPAIPHMRRLVAKQDDLILKDDNAMPETPPETPGDGKKVETPDEKLMKIRALLKDKGIASAEQATSREAILDAVIAFLEGRGTEDAAVASSVRGVLGLSPDADKNEILLAMRVVDTPGVAAELTAMREADADRVAQERVDRCVKNNQLNPTDSVAMSAALGLAREHPDRFDALMTSYVPHVTPGRTVEASRDRRSVLILKAAGDYRSDADLAATCSAQAAINLALREAGMQLLSDDELRQYVAQK